jgi:hypothetical protein
MKKFKKENESMKIKKSVDIINDIDYFEKIEIINDSFE